MIYNDYYPEGRSFNLKRFKDEIIDRKNGYNNFPMPEEIMFCIRKDGLDAKDVVIYAELLFSSTYDKKTDLLCSISTIYDISFQLDMEEDEIIDCIKNLVQHGWIWEIKRKIGHEEYYCGRPETRKNIENWNEDFPSYSFYLNVTQNINDSMIRRFLNEPDFIFSK